MDYTLKIKKKSSSVYSTADLFNDVSIGFQLDFYNADNIDKIKVPVSTSLSLPMTEGNVSIIDYDPTSDIYNNIPEEAYDFELYLNANKVLEGNMYIESYSFNNNTPVIDVRLIDRLQEIFDKARQSTLKSLYSDLSLTQSLDVFLSTKEGAVGQEPTRSDIILPYVDLCNDVEKFNYAARQFLQWGFDKDKVGLIPALNVPAFIDRFFSAAGVGVTSRFLELGSYGTSIDNNIPNDMYMLLPTKIVAGSRTRTRGFYLNNGPGDLFRSQYTADAKANISSAREVESFESANLSYGWNYNPTDYTEPIDNGYGLDYKTNDRNKGDALTNAYFGSHMSYTSVPVDVDIFTQNDRYLSTGNYVQFGMPMIRVSANNYAIVNDIFPASSTAKVVLVATLWVDGSPTETYRMQNLDGTIKELDISDATTVGVTGLMTPYRVSINNQWGYIDGSAIDYTFNLRFDHTDIGGFKWEHKEFEIMAGSTYAVSIGFEILEGEIDVEYVSSWTQTGTHGGGLPEGQASTYGTKTVSDEDVVKGIFMVNASTPSFISELYLALRSTGPLNPYFLDDDVNISWSFDDIDLSPFEITKEVLSRFNLSAVYNQEDNTVIIDRFTDFRDSNVKNIEDKLDDREEFKIEIVNKIAKSIEISTSANSLYYDNFGYGKELINKAGSDDLKFSLSSRAYNKSLCGGETYVEIPHGFNEFEIGFTLNEFTSHKDIGIVFGYIDKPQYKTRLRRGRFISKLDYKGLIYDIIEEHAFPRFVGEKTGTMPLYYYNKLGVSTDLYAFFKGNDNVLFYSRPKINFKALLEEDYAFDIKNNYSLVSIPHVKNSTLVIKSVDGSIFDGGIYADIEAIIL